MLHRLSSSFLLPPRSQQVGVAAGAFGAAAPAPGQAGGGAPTAAGGGGVSEGAVERRKEFMLESLVCAVEVLFFIFYSYQVRVKGGGRERMDR